MNYRQQSSWHGFWKFFVPNQYMLNCTLKRLFYVKKVFRKRFLSIQSTKTENAQFLPGKMTGIMHVPFYILLTLSRHPHGRIGTAEIFAFGPTRLRRCRLPWEQIGAACSLPQCCSPPEIGYLQRAECYQIHELQWVSLKVRFSNTDKLYRSLRTPLPRNKCSCESITYNALLAIM